MLPVPRKAKSFIGIVLLCFSHCFTLSSAVMANNLDLDTGTFVAVVMKKDYLIVGADSRRTTMKDDGTKLIRDDQCKILPLNDSLVFTHMGNASARTQGVT